MMQIENTNRLKKIFNDAITGQVSLNVRKRLASGKTVNVSVNEEKYSIFVVRENAFMTLGNVPIADAPFVPWCNIDDDYEKMITTFGDEGVNEEWFQSASEAYFARFY